MSGSALFITMKDRHSDIRSTRAVHSGSNENAVLVYESNSRLAESTAPVYDVRQPIFLYQINRLLEAAEGLFHVKNNPHDLHLNLCLFARLPH